MIGVFGSAFNPPTLGHKNAIQQAAKQCQKILLVPSASHAFGKNMLPFELRFNMLVRFISDIQSEVGCPIEVSSIEQEMITDGFNPVYTIDVFERLEQKLKTDKLAFILGPDNADTVTWAKFYKNQEIDQRWNKIICQESVQVRSTLIREYIRSGCTDQTLLELTTPSVVSVIRADDLYK